MNDLVSPSPSIKLEDIPIASREFSREFSLPFRPSPAPSNRSLSLAIERTPGPNKAAKNTPLDSSLLRVQKYLKYPGLDMPDIIITEQNRGFVAVFGLDRDLLFSGPPDLPIEPTDMPSCVCYKVEHLFSAVFGVLNANKDSAMDWRQYWNKVQRVLAKENPLWKTEVTANKIRDLAQLFTNARMNYLENPSVSKLQCLADRQNCRLLKSIDRYIAFKADKFSITDMLQLEAKDRWMNGYRVRRYRRHQDVEPVDPAPARLALMAPRTSMMNPDAIIALIATIPS
ncbi:hypothetical protein CSIM01_06668 [Colletotrichum simmondsii]|uniref:Uncharacterized protein n=1 Tax=Colletotrichum simmondsii TaxID=703756 RepID=A0A135SUL0_9PEZI|nr:hypothetical protein CSIM01_06668 [Colletotrichum simmondsii]